MSSPLHASQPSSKLLLSEAEYANHLDDDLADAEQFLADAEEDINHAIHASHEAHRVAQIHDILKNITTQQDSIVRAHARARAATERIANPRVEQLIIQQKGGRAGVLAQHKMKTERWNEDEPSRMISSMTAYERELEAAEENHREQKKIQREKQRKMKQQQIAASAPSSPTHSPLFTTSHLSPYTSRPSSSQSTPSLFTSQPSRITSIANAAADVAMASTKRSDAKSTSSSPLSSPRPAPSSTYEVEHIRSSAIKGTSSTRAYRASTHTLPETRPVKERMLSRGITCEEDTFIPPPPPPEDDDDIPPPPPPTSSMRKK